MSDANERTTPPIHKLLSDQVLTDPGCKSIFELLVPWGDPKSHWMNFIHPLKDEEKDKALEEKSTPYRIIARLVLTQSILQEQLDFHYGNFTGELFTFLEALGVISHQELSISTKDDPAVRGKSKAIKDTIKGFVRKQKNSHSKNIALAFRDNVKKDDDLFPYSHELQSDGHEKDHEAIHAVEKLLLKSGILKPGASHRDTVKAVNKLVDHKNAPREV